MKREVVTSRPLRRLDAQAQIHSPDVAARQSLLDRRGLLVSFLVLR